MRTSIKESDLADQFEQVDATPDVTAAESRARIRKAIENRYTLPA